LGAKGGGETYSAVESIRHGKWGSTRRRREEDKYEMDGVTEKLMAWKRRWGPSSTPRHAAMPPLFPLQRRLLDLVVTAFSLLSAGGPAPSSLEVGTPVIGSMIEYGSQTMFSHGVAAFALLMRRMHGGWGPLFFFFKLF